MIVPLSGFLGAGKTTLMLKAAELLRARGLIVACVTNDQGGLLIDSNMVKHQGGISGQVLGGCFCCRFNELTDTLNVIMAAHSPDVIVIEAVGSCTDLTATVIRPLQSLHGDRIHVMPLTTVIDPLRLEEMSQSDTSEAFHGTSVFSAEIDYIYHKQLADADNLLLNKADLLQPIRLTALFNLLQTQYPEANVLQVSSFSGEGVNAWLNLLAAVTETRFGNRDGSKFNIDYDTYAAGEEQLGWLNASMTVEGHIGDVPHMCQLWTEELAADITGSGGQVAHLKLWAQDAVHQLKISQVRNHESCLTDLQPEHEWSAQHLSI